MPIIVVIIIIIVDENIILYGLILNELMSISIKTGEYLIKPLKLIG